jgi:hypothetical protein
LDKIILPNGITSIGSDTFSGCISIKEIIIPENVTFIGNGAFAHCTSLTEVIVPSSVEDFSGAFQGCTSLTDVTILKGSATSIGFSTFVNCYNLKNITIPNNIASIGMWAFSECLSLKNITLPDSVTFIDEFAFYRCENLSSIKFSENLTSIGEFAFDYCINLKEVIMPDSVLYIGERAFSSCHSLTNLKIPKGITEIKEGTFANCTSLTSIVIPSNIANIGKNAFTTTEFAPASSSLMTVYFKHLNASDITLMEDVFSGVPQDFKIIYPANSIGFTNPWYGYPAFPAESVIIESDIYEIEPGSNFMKGIESGDKVSEIKNNLTVDGANIDDLLFYKYDGTLLSDTDKIGTGSYITDDINFDEPIIVIIISGDLTGEGDIDKNDFEVALEYIQSETIEKLDEEVFTKAAKMSNGEKVDIEDVMKIREKIKNKILILD